MSRRALDDGVVRLVRPGPGHEAAFRNLRARSGRFLSRWEPRPPLGVELGGGAEWERFLGGARDPRRERWLCERIRDGELIGQVGLSMIEKEPFSNVVLGWWIGKPHTRKGHGVRMVELGLRRAFDGLGLARAEANIRPENEASRALARRLGFRMEGFSTAYLEIDGRRRDHERWAMLATEWEARTQARNRT